jgi:hypothetical protein
MTAQDPPGVENGVLVNPEAYFFSLINREPNQPADDWEQVLAASGIPKGFTSGEVPTDNGFYGLTQQIGTDGRIAGRIFLPTAEPDVNGYYSQPISPLKDAATAGHLLWEWRLLSHSPAYVPVTGDGTVPPVTGNTEQRIETLESQVANHESRIAKLEQSPMGKVPKKIAMIASNGEYVTAEVETKGKPMVVRGNKADAWQQFTVEVLEWEE